MPDELPEAIQPVATVPAQASTPGFVAQLPHLVEPIIAVAAAEKQTAEAVAIATASTKEATLKELLAKVGVKDITALEKYVADHKRLSDAIEAEAEAKRTELERAQAAAKMAEERAATALQLAESTLLTAAIQVEAQRLGALNIEFVTALIDHSGVKVDVAKREVLGVREAIEALKARPGGAALFAVPAETTTKVEVVQHVPESPQPGDKKSITDEQRKLLDQVRGQMAREYSVQF